MQRVHLNDLTGYLLENSEGWTVLSLPAIAEVREEIAIGPGKLHVRQPGEALHPEREPLDALEKLRQELGSDVFAAQYQQAPVPPGGAMIRGSGCAITTTLPERTYRTKIIQSGTPPPKTARKMTGPFARPGCWSTNTSTCSI